ncbi:hypothetical protein [Streptomyces sp. NPDC085596]|uniref:hypothetical protein n=1 Tax=Streptomyces sp. NPDC085596 TaxID=3365731 RepID=UPI0037D4951E
MNSDRTHREAVDRYGDAPNSPAEALKHVLAVYAGEPDEMVVLTATTRVYLDAPWTGLRLGDLRALAAQLTA